MEQTTQTTPQEHNEQNLSKEKLRQQYLLMRKEVLSHYTNGADFLKGDDQTWTPNEPGWRATPTGWVKPDDPNMRINS